MRLIPGKTKVKIELFRGVTIGDVVVGTITLALAGLVILSTLPARLYIAIGVIAAGGLLLFRLDAQPNYVALLHLLKYLALPRRFWRTFSDRHLLSDKRESRRGENWNEFFEDKYKAENVDSISEKIENIRSKKKKKKEDDELLASNAVSDDVKNGVWQEREWQGEI